MTPVEWSMVRDRVYSLWGKSPKWSNAASLTGDVTSIPVNAALTTVDDHIGKQYAPSPADIIAGARAQLVGGPPPRVKPGPEDCDHPQWAIVEYLEDGRRRGQCRVCYQEQLFQTGRLLMEWEIEEKRHATQSQDVF